MNKKFRAEDYLKFGLIYFIVQSIVFIIGKLYFRLSARGREYIPKKGSAIVAISHRSFLDPPLVGGIVWRQMHFMARHDLFDVPFLGRLIANLKTFPVKRGAFDRSALKLTLDFLKLGEAVAIFPEGTRSPDGELQPPFAGVGMIVHHAQVPVIPAYAAGTYECYPRKAKYPHPGKVTIYFGPAVDLKALLEQPASKEVYQQIAEKIMQDIAKLIPAK
jgi:1-acyl-sn-glycerol-3-phosphate acyltransferase